MPSMTFTHPSGKSITVQGTTPPSEQELDGMFSQAGFDKPAGGGLPDAPKPPMGLNKASKITGPRTWGESIRENLPMIFGTTAGTGAALTGYGAPMAVTAATVGAGTGESLKQAWRAWDGLPTPPTVTDSLENMGESAVLNGTLPELAGQGTGFLAKKAGNLIMRKGAAARNVKLFDETANPTAVPLSASGKNAGPALQRQQAGQHLDMKSPLQEGYDQELAGPFGHARRLKVTEGPPDPRVISEPGPRVTSEGPTSFSVTDEPQVGESVLMADDPTTFDVGPSGPANSMRHAARSASLKDARRLRANPAAQQEAHAAEMAAKRQHSQMLKAAEENGVDPQQYLDLNEAWGQMSALHGNKFIQDTSNRTGESLIDMMSNPQGWAKKTFKVARLDGTRTAMSNVELVKTYKEALNNPEAWQILQAAVSKNLVNKSRDMHGAVDPTKLAASLKNMTDNGAGELVPASKKLLEMAQILDKSSAGMPDVPHVGPKARVVNWALRTLKLPEPDLRRALAQKAGKQGLEENIAEMLTRSSFLAATQDMPEEDIPDPPPTQRMR